ncbi:MAG: hypothetical protein HY788_13945 [Deltaproteobacteria bacterium]|nr:hypothetical protein [Deltaproteobacteria bacterium]
MDINDLFERIMKVAYEVADRIEAARMRDQKCRTAVRCLDITWVDTLSCGKFFMRGRGIISFGSSR